MPALPPVDGAAAVPSLRTLGTGATQAASGTDSRLSDSRAPSGTAGGQLTGTYPNPSVLTSILGGVAWTTVTKAGDESVSSSTALQNDDELFFTATANKVYEIQAIFIYGSPLGGGTPDITIGLGEDATVRGTYMNVGLNSADSGTQTVQGFINNGGVTRGTAATDRGCYVYGTVTGNGGTLNVVWAQATSGGNATIMRAGSVLRYRRLI